LPSRRFYWVSPLSLAGFAILNHLFAGDISDFPKPMASVDASTFEFCRHSTLSIVRRLYLANQPHPIPISCAMGYIKHFDGCLKDGTLYADWVDVKTGDFVDYKDVRGKIREGSHELRRRALLR
jgi:hypothetical protein